MVDAMVPTVHNCSPFAPVTASAVTDTAAVETIPEDAPVAASVCVPPARVGGTGMDALSDPVALACTDAENAGVE